MLQFPGLECKLTLPKLYRERALEKEGTILKHFPPSFLLHLLFKGRCSVVKPFASSDILLLMSCHLGESTRGDCRASPCNVRGSKDRLADWEDDLMTDRLTG
ncbi:hypothetical protein E2C01_045319 [Portunus trituberculatus]|uniref:Uncharacterized protein n=1 Tax=Portunus trituberculatus TaxID=210409 RepID=A0A5B7G2J4_PORTR|nr:hypothetical protein [Portunus trituberculatus]